MWYLQKMTNYILDGHDLSALFDSSTNPISFSEDPRRHIPNKGSITEGQQNFARPQLN